MIAVMAAARATKMPTPRLAKKNSSGIEITRMTTKIVASAPIAITNRLSGRLAGSWIPASRSGRSSMAGQEEDGLAEPAGVPADHGGGDAVAGLLARVPAPSGRRASARGRRPTWAARPSTRHRAHAARSARSAAPPVAPSGAGSAAERARGDSTAEYPRHSRGKPGFPVPPSTATRASRAWLRRGERGSADFHRRIRGP